MKRNLLARYRFVVFWILSVLIFLVGVVGAGAWYYKNQKENLRAEVWEDLNAVADLKTAEIAEWRRSRLAEANLLGDNSVLARSVQLLLHRKTEGRPGVAGVLQPFRRHTQFEKIMLLDSAGSVLWSDPEPSGIVSSAERNLAAEATASKKTLFSDLFLQEERHVSLLLAVPVKSQSTQDVIAVVLLHVDPNSYLFPLIMSWPAPSRTAETLLVRRDGDAVVFLNRLRHTDHPPLTFRLPLTRDFLPAGRAALQQESTLEGIDYRGVPVLAVTRRIPDSSWGMVAKIDLDESYAAVNRTARATLRQVALLVATLALAAALILTTHVARLRKKAEEAILRSHQELEKRVAERTEELRRLTCYLEEVHEEQSKRISEEIHDQLGSSLTAARLQLLALQSDCASAAPESAAKLRSVTELIGTIQSDVRRISRGLRPPALDHLGLAPALETLMDEFRERTGIQCTLTVGLDRATLPSGDWSVSVYRIFQESLTNVARHAAATRVDAFLTSSNGRLNMEIRDNGKGFEPGTGRSKSCGILGMKERALRLGGELSFVRLEPNGTSVRAWFPLPPADRPEA